MRVVTPKPDPPREEEGERRQAEPSAKKKPIKENSMKKKSLRPQIVAPVQRETTATTTSNGVGVVASWRAFLRAYNPFAGDDAE